ncbi:hypothetical protein ACFX15_034122 [Malus domestica]|uniref:Leucine-rich repeat-containing N-terminal plant-type domain-containing protein n=1 Tax=Malus domestica TaxID=3750 RepID=A0A498K0Q9_MALDO|nr:uncharacterized protein At4g06744-like [Malus sylvestris]RXH99883.1 hypothetical protein DVH24_021685 [Malus domestica]
MATFSFFSSLLISTFLVHLCLYHYKVEALEIIIGGGGGEASPPAPSPEYEDCPPPPPPPCPPPPSLPPPPPPSLPLPPPPKLQSPPPPLPPKLPPPPSSGPFESERLEVAFNVVKRFVAKIKSDPKGFAKTWKGPNVCRYKGFVCAVHPVYKQKTVSGIDINGAMLGGDNNKLPLDGFLDKLEDLVFFHANSNNFTGSVPIGTAMLRYFYELDLSNNKLSGGFPYEVLTATNLTFLDLRFNFFAGPVPARVIKLDVDVLFLNNNCFTQQIPDDLGSSPAHYFTFANNNFTGPIPRSIGQASRTLYEVLFLGNKLSGCLPYEIGYLNQATVFDASSNCLTGPIPASFACLAKIEFLNLAKNQLYGPVPEMVCMLSNLENLSLADNYFTEVGPECQKLIDRKKLDVSRNCILDQPNQRINEECATFFSMPIKCPNEKEMINIPCKRPYSGSNEKKSDHLPRAPLSYGTLVPHRL